jgi:hypothetical protein
MKQLTFRMRAAYITVFCCLLQTIIFAQDSTSTTTSTSSSTKVSIEEGTDWYSSPWVWVAGAAVFILLLVALLRSGGDKTVDRRDTVVHKETVRKDNDI